MQKLLESIIHIYESAPIVEKFKFTRDEFMYLYLTAKGCEHYILMDYFDCQKDKLYRLRKRIIRKMKAHNFIHALAIFMHFHDSVDW